MSKINLEFSSYQEMANFAKMISDTGSVTPTEVLEVSGEVSTPQAQSYGQQIANNFPIANSSQVPLPTQQTEPVQTQVTPQQQVPTTTKDYKLDELASAAMVLMDRGMQAQLQQLLIGYGVETLPQLPAEQYGNFATALRGMGAQI